MKENPKKVSAWNKNSFNAAHVCTSQWYYGVGHLPQCVTVSGTHSLAEFSM